ncbi:MAG: diadenylate cyclase CdaA [Oscillospiraceae bacterium]|nr:diadenylate cyclase CdaA [Oscillospiraceae bacterium]
MLDFFGTIINAIGGFFAQVWVVILSFQLRDALDIALVALMIYGLIRLIRQTRGMQLLKGVFWVAIVALIAGVLRMEASWFIFRQVMDNAVVLLVVLFQPEIRTVFERLGRNPVTNLKFLQQQNKTEREQEEIEKAIHTICEVLRQFSKHRTGALIVFEGVTQLGEIAKTGTLLKAVVSRELLHNIFHSKAPLHDGAVIIRRGRILAAGCILPLPQDSEVESDFGTRHRAAIGMSEQSDAMVCVVSEETGHVSLAYKGELRWGITPEEVGQGLRGLLLEGDTANKRFVLNRRKKGGSQ